MGAISEIAPYPSSRRFLQGVQERQLLASNHGPRCVFSTLADNIELLQSRQVAVGEITSQRVIESKYALGIEGRFMMRGWLLSPGESNGGMFQDEEREYVETARVGRLATADTEARPHVVPICFTLSEGHVVTPIDEKPQRASPKDLRRSRDITENPQVTVLVDHYSNDWSQLGWVQVRGTATNCTPSDASHSPAVAALEQKYEQYAEHDLETRPLIRISPESVRSWGRLDRPNNAHSTP